MPTGKLIRALPKSTFDFSNVPVGTTQLLDVVERIEVSSAIDCMVAVRVHGATLTGGSITFDLLGDGHSEEEPGLGFATASPLFTAIAIPPAVGLVTYGGTVRTEYAKLRVSGNRSSAAALLATVSIDLVLRSPDDL
jgi:hypothetical protein